MQDLFIQQSKDSMLKLIEVSLEAKHVPVLTFHIEVGLRVRGDGIDSYPP